MVVINRSMIKRQVKNDALKKAVELCGGQTELARLVNKHLPENVSKASQALIWSWLFRTGKVLAEYVIAIEKATSGTVTRHELRPDLYPLEAPADSAA